jgi:hypothetical protein
MNPTPPSSSEPPSCCCCFYVGTAVHKTKRFTGTLLIALTAFLRIVHGEALGVRWASTFRAAASSS